MNILSDILDFGVNNYDSRATIFSCAKCGVLLPIVRITPHQDDKCLKTCNCGYDWYISPYILKNLIYTTTNKNITI